VLHETDFRNVINFPLVDASVLKTLRPYLNLAEKMAASTPNWPKAPSNGWKSTLP